MEHVPQANQIFIMMKTSIFGFVGATALSLMAGSANAQSSVTAYGMIDTGFAYANHVGNGSQTVFKAQDSILGVSTFGMKGSEDLSGGLRAIFNLQMGFNPSTGRMDNPNAGTFDRNAYVGFDSPSGTLTFGHQWNLNDDWLVGSVFGAGYNSGAPFKFHEFDAISEYYNNAVKYVSPTFGGLQVAGFYSFGGFAGDFTRGSVLNVGARYTTGPLYVAATYDQESTSSASGDKYKLATAGARYDFGPARARLGYAHANITGPGTFQSIPSQPAQSANVYEAGIDFVAIPTVILSGDYLYKQNTTAHNHTSEYRLLATYSLSKRTSLLANIALLSNSGGATEAMYNVDSPLPGTYGGLPNSTQTAFTVGVRHAF
ncbi:porin [Burkholderia pyrrocinia]|uniref:porin n=1 Tax=Burkholderia pyrrocinia TaxID=60550 RepID=UPI002AB16470|nr:porin [Burkholderia pyrrocinia]